MLEQYVGNPNIYIEELTPIGRTIYTMTKTHRKDGPHSGMFGIGLVWDADGKIKPPLTEEHEKLDLKVVAARKRWNETKSDEDYERLEALEQELNQAINKAFETFHSD